MRDVNNELAKLSGSKYNGMNMGDLALLGSLNVAAPLIPDATLAAYYKFDEASGNIVNQSLGAAKISSSDLVTSGVTYGVAGIIDDAVSTDGINDFMDASSSAAADWGFLNKSGNSWTICFWYKMLTQQFQRFMATANFSAGDAGILFYENGVARDFTFIMGKNGTDQITWAPTKTTPNDANWHFMYLSYSDATGDFIFNIDNGTRETLGSQNLTNTDNPETFLNLADNSAGQDFANMAWDEMSIWNGKVLDSTEEGLLYNSGSGAAIY